MDLVTSLVPLAVASAILPVQITITILLLQAQGGRAKALAWVTGMTVVRLAQWVVFGVVIGTASAAQEEAGAGPIQATLLLVVAVLFLVSAVRKLLDQPDEDAPPPRWMAAVSGIGAGRAFLFGAAAVGLSPKLWAFTLGAIAAIADAGLGVAGGWGAFLAFVLAAESIHLALIAAAFASPARADALLGSVSATLERHNRTLMIGLGLVFGTWFLLKALAAFGLL
ncbi:MAG TPA: GAP family protein [Candidatus Limnocylindrales bacterium]|nr:GAP family protein [Candidatus Limnocylindrales bacterium]